MKTRVGHSDVNDAVFQRIAKLKLQRDKLDALHASLSLQMSRFEEQAELYGQMKELVEFTYTGRAGD